MLIQLLQGMQRFRGEGDKMILMSPSFTHQEALDAVNKPAQEMEGGENVNTTLRYATCPSCR